MKQIMIFSTIVLLLISCETNDKSKIVHSENINQEIIDPKKDSTFIEIADLPIEIDSTDYLIHPIGYFKKEESRGKIIYKSSGYGSQNFSVSNYGNNKLSGDLTNIKFQHKDSDELVSLTDEFVKIKSLTFLRDVFNNCKKRFLVYEVTDKDSNQDGIIDYNDITSLYLSKIDGTNFIKLSEDNREILQWKVIESQNRLYFKTVEDKNKDGEFDKTDSLHYKFINLNNDDLKVMEYMPILITPQSHLYILQKKLQTTPYLY